MLARDVMRPATLDEKVHLGITFYPSSSAPTLSRWRNPSFASKFPSLNQLASFFHLLCDQSELFILAMNSKGLTMKHRHHHRPVKKANEATWVEKEPSKIPATVQSALRDAMLIEGVSMTQYDDFLWIIAQESGGIVNTRNPASSARGLFQLLRAQYPLNPHGEESFGKAVEECQGGIHYVMGRYHSAKTAKTFWQAHHWY